MNIPQTIQEQMQNRIKQEMKKAYRFMGTILMAGSVCLVILTTLLLYYSIAEWDTYSRLDKTVQVVMCLIVAGATFAAFFYTYRQYRDYKRYLDVTNIMSWYLESPSDSVPGELVTEIETLIKEHWQGEKSIVQLQEYKIHLKNQTNHLVFNHDGSEIMVPLKNINYDGQSPRIEFYVSDQDWSVNIRKGQLFDFVVYNV